MSFSYLSGIITQTGTDTDLSGLNGVTNVTVSDYSAEGGMIIYKIAPNTTLVIAGTLSSDPQIEQLILDPVKDITKTPIEISGTYTLGYQKTNQGYTDSVKSIGIVFTDKDADSTAGILKVTSTGTFNWYSGILCSHSTPTVNHWIIFDFGSTVNIYDGFIESYGGTATSAGFSQIRCNTNNVTVDGFYCDGFMFTFQQEIISFKGFNGSVSRSAGDICGVISAGDGHLIELEDFITGKTTCLDAFNWGSGKIKMINNKYGSDCVLKNGHRTDGEGVMEVLKRLELAIYDSSGTAIEGARYYIIDTDNGSRSPADIYSTNYSDDREYTDVSDSSGVFANFEVLTYVVYGGDWISITCTDNATRDYRSNSGDDSDDFDILYRKYGYNQKELTSLALKGTGNYTSNDRLTSDNYAVATETVAGAYTGVTIDGATNLVTVSGTRIMQELYDYSKYWSATATGIKYDEPFSTSNGTTFATAYDTTISGLLTGSSKTIASTADVTLSGTGSTELTIEITGGTFTSPVFANVDGDVNLIGGTWVLSDVGTAVGGTADATSHITVDTANTDDEFVFSAYTFDASTVFENTSGNNIIIALSAGQQQPTKLETSGTITFQQPIVYTGITFDGLIAGSQVIVFETGTQTVIDSVETSTTSFDWSEVYAGDQTVDYTIINEGYFPIRVTGVAVSDSVQTVAIQQKVDRAYQVSSGLTFGTTATVDTGTSRFGVTTDTTVQNWYSFMMESWRDQSTLKNVLFPLVTNGSNSFTLAEWEFDGATSIGYLSRDGFRYTASDVITAVYSAIQALGETYSLPITYQQEDGTGTSTASSLDGMLQVYGDATHGNFDYTDHLVVKIQADGYDEATADVYSTYGTLEDQYYVIALNPTSNGLATGDPSVTGVTITDHGATPVTWNGLDYSITITDSATPHTGTEIMRWIRYNFSLGGTFQGTDAFNWHDLVHTNGTKFKTVNGKIYGDVGATIKGVRVVKNDGTTPHPDFNVHTADDGSTYEPPTVIVIKNVNLADDTRVRLYNETQSTELDNSLVTGGSGFSYDATVGVGEEVEEGDTISMKSAYNSGTTYYNETSESAVASTSNMTMLTTQSSNTVLDGYSIDGSAQTDFAVDYPNIEIDIDSGDTSRDKLLCWLAYIITTEDGIRNFFGAVTNQDAGNSIINTSVVDLKLDYTGTGNSKFTDTIWLKRDDDANIFGGAGDNFYATSDKVYIAETGTSGLTPSESTQLSQISDVADDTTIIKKWVGWLRSLL